MVEHKNDGTCLSRSSPQFGVLRYDLLPTIAIYAARIRGTLAEHFRRIDPRYDRQLSVEVSCEGEDQIGRSRNVSLGGMYFEGRKALPIAAAVTLRFHIPTQPEAVEVAGDVRWIVNTPGSADIGIGIRFQGLRARDVWALNRFFQTAS